MTANEMMFFMGLAAIVFVPLKVLASMEQNTILTERERCIRIIKSGQDLHSAEWIIGRIREGK